MKGRPNNKGRSDYGIGVSTIASYDIKKVDLDCFTESSTMPEIRINKANIDEIIRQYFSQVSELKIPIRDMFEKNDTYQLLKVIKREAVGTGPYPHVSLFENCNRIFSDLVIFFGVRRLLHELNDRFSFIEYRVLLGTQHGIDIQSEMDGKSLAGEAFNVAKSFFYSKKSSSLKNLLGTTANRKILIFNSDAVSNPYQYDLRTEKGVCNLTVDVEKGLRILDLL